MTESSKEFVERMAQLLQLVWVVFAISRELQRPLDKLQDVLHSLFGALIPIVMVRIELSKMLERHVSLRTFIEAKIG